MRASRERRNARRHRMITQINFVPFTDVVLVLLVIFMMTATFMGREEGGLELRLPTAASAQERQDPAGGVVVTIPSGGDIVVDEQPVPDVELVHRLAQRAREKHTRLVVVRADRAVAYERVAHTIDAAKLAGLNDLALSTEMELDTAVGAPRGEEQ